MSEQAQPKSRWGSGFLWGCLTPLLIVGAIVLCAVAYAVYYFGFGYKNDSTLQTVLSTLQQNATARSVLGDNIEITGFPNYSFNYNTNARVHTARYNFGVHGSKGDGTIAAACNIVGSHVDIKNLILTAPNGRVYYLIGTTGAPNTNAVWLLRPRLPLHIPSIAT
ncbi:MAG TPA: cytochrome c oxidase assembly factor Coa1 family protein [Rhizomicrobium sp.]|jgi:hypothetical protein|nr:cytochrome c oxidase assembly factor Coa1 family protein [Rhizomicrobium sp.]